MPTQATEIDVGGTPVRVTNPDRVIYPATDSSPEATKLDVVQYYASVGEAIMRAVRNRPTTLERWPKGVLPDVKQTTRSDPHGDAFFQKRIPKGAPPYVETARITFPSGRVADEVCPTEPAVVAWAAQIGTITFHPWPVRSDDVEHPDELRIDLDPQPGVGFDEVRVAAARVRTLLDELGIAGYPKTSGNRGIHVYVRLAPEWDSFDVRSGAIALARELERRHPELITAQWWKEERGERVFVDFNQNAPHKTVFGAWFARPRIGGQVSTPLSWDEVDSVDPEALTIRTVPDLVQRRGDPWAHMVDHPQSLQPLLDMAARDRENGLRDAPWPPEYPKQPDEPMRVAPSRAKKA
jgi:DNA ligase D